MISWKVNRQAKATLYVKVTGECGHDATLEDLRAALDNLNVKDSRELCSDCAECERAERAEVDLERIRLAMDAPHIHDLPSLAASLWASSEAYDGFVDELRGVLGLTRADSLIPAVVALRAERDEARAECERLSKERSPQPIEAMQFQAAHSELMAVKEQMQDTIKERDEALAKCERLRRASRQRGENLAVVIRECKLVREFVENKVGKVGVTLQNERDKASKIKAELAEARAECNRLKAEWNEAQRSIKTFVVDKYRLETENEELRGQCDLMRPVVDACKEAAAAYHSSKPVGPGEPCESVLEEAAFQRQRAVMAERQLDDCTAECKTLRAENEQLRDDRDLMRYEQNATEGHEQDGADERVRIRRKRDEVDTGLPIRVGDVWECKILNEQCVVIGPPLLPGYGWTMQGCRGRQFMHGGAMARGEWTFVRRAEGAVKEGR